MRLFSQRGFRGTTTKEIAAAAGVSEAMVFRHFATKEELYSAILDHKACLHDETDPLLKVAQAIEHKDDLAVFEGIALGALSHHEDDPEFQRLLLTRLLSSTSSRRCSGTIRAARIPVVGNYIRERQREGAIINVEPALVVPPLSAW